ncbi:MAG: hypothetical protein AC479_06930 [miscellaneous Crenarchaeota group-6 archaeon AD8-1]|nr:MAG: hypothetical protein AC479_06930 [miscellaneous Crenarchaeota group-6 archaeon AD8-1]
MTQPIFRWNGKYFGFIWKNRLFNEKGEYIAWVDGEEVWNKDGTYLGDLFEQTYILRPTKIENKPSCIPKEQPSEHPTKPELCPSREPRESRKNYVDALDEFL